MRTTIYGYIEEMDFGYDLVTQEIKAHNKKIILSLQSGDSWPPLSKEMFSICENVNDEGPNLEFSGRVIHFGANLKSVESDWKEWKSKFENLLENL